MTTPVECVLDQLSGAFTVRHVMTAVDDLVRADGQCDAQKVLEDHPRFDIIPIPSRGPLTGYFRRDGLKIEPIHPTDLISDGTSLLDLPNLMTEREFFFVRSSDLISGFLHFSDLNKVPVKLPFFVLFEAVEGCTWRKIEGRLTKPDLLKVLGAKRVEYLKRRADQAIDRNVDLGSCWAGLLYFSEILKLAVFYRQVDLSPEDQKLLNKIRNKIAHSGRHLVGKHTDTQDLVRSRELCQQLLAK